MNNTVSVWFIDIEMESMGVQEMIDDDIARLAKEGYEFVNVTATPVDRKAVMFLHFRKSASPS